MMWWCIGALSAAVLAWPRPLRWLPVAAGPATPPRPAGKLLRPWRRGAARSQARRIVLDILELLAPSLAAGVPPPVAVATCVELVAQPLPADALRSDLIDLGRAARRGEPLGTRWEQLAIAHGVDDLDIVGRAWSMSDRLGCGLNRSLQTAITLIRSQIDQEQHLRETAAGPRATMHLLTLLPVAGVGLCALMGVDPTRLYAGRLTVLALLPGCALLLAGRWLMRRMIASASHAKPLT